MNSKINEIAGAHAASPWAIPARGWKAVLLRAWNEAGEDNIGLIAAGVAFYAFLSIVPLLGATVLVYGLAADPHTVGEHVASLTSVMPRDVAKLIGDQLLQVVTTSEGKKGFGLIIALALALYGAMSGAGAIVTALNVAYEEHEDRSFVTQKLLALGVTAGAVVLVLGAMGTVAAVALLGDLMPWSPTWLVVGIRLSSYVLLAGLAAAGAATLYRYGPDRRHAQWTWLTPGSVAATVIWLAMTTGFGFYVANFGSYDATYGSLGAIVVMLTWLSLSAYVFLLGAELNSELERQTDRDTTDGPVRPMGHRGASVADQPAVGLATTLPNDDAEAKQPVTVPPVGAGMLPTLMATGGLAALKRGRGWGAGLLAAAGAVAWLRRTSR